MFVMWKIGIIDFLVFFIDFWRPQGLPKSRQNRWNSPNGAKKWMSKNTCFSPSLFSRFCVVFASKNGVQIAPFSVIARKRRLCENHCFSKGKLLFLTFPASWWGSKINAAPHSKKASPKYAKKSILNLIWTPQNLQKSTENAPKTWNKTLKKNMLKNGC